MDKEQRYYVSGDTEHPCCHSAAIVDRNTGKTLCEVFNEEDAFLIADALNNVPRPS